MKKKSIGALAAVLLAVGMVSVPTGAQAVSLNPVCHLSVDDSFMTTDSKIVASIRIWCTRSTEVAVWYQAMEADKGPDDQMGPVYGGDFRDILIANTWYTFQYNFPCYDEDFAGKEEPYVHARIQNDGVSSGTLSHPWTDGVTLSASCVGDDPFD